MLDQFGYIFRLFFPIIFYLCSVYSTELNCLLPLLLQLHTTPYFKSYWLFWRVYFFYTVANKTGILATWAFYGVTARLYNLLALYPNPNFSFLSFDKVKEMRKPSRKPKVQRRQPSNARSPDKSSLIYGLNLQRSKALQINWPLSPLPSPSNALAKDTCST